jgi:hypothetical protein
MSRLPLQLVVKAISLPSGDQEGLLSQLGSSVSLRIEPGSSTLAT